MSSDTPAITVLRGDPSEDEIAAIVGALAMVAARASVTDGPASMRSAWNHPARLVRRPLPHGPGAWRWSAVRL